MKKLLIGSLAVFGFPVFAFGATYSYVTNAGTLATVEASNPTQAIAIAPNIHPNSGVMLQSESAPQLQFGANLGAGSNTYRYVDMNGNLRTVTASSAAQALMIAPNIHPNSGVMLVS